MDEAGIDLQVISENNPPTQNLDAESAVKLARASNDVLYEAVRAHPDRFAGFATLPTLASPIRPDLVADRGRVGTECFNSGLRHRRFVWFPIV